MGPITLVQLYADFNELIRPGLVYIHSRMQPSGALPDLKEGQRVLLVEWGDDETSEAILHRDGASGEWYADVNAVASEVRSAGAVAAG